MIHYWGVKWGYHHLRKHPYIDFSKLALTLFVSFARCQDVGDIWHFWVSRIEKDFVNFLALATSYQTARETVKQNALHLYASGSDCYWCYWRQIICLKGISSVPVCLFYGWSWRLWFSGRSVLYPCIYDPFPCPMIGQIGAAAQISQYFGSRPLPTHIDEL